VNNFVKNIRAKLQLSRDIVFERNLFALNKLGLTAKVAKHTKSKKEWFLFVLFARFAVINPNGSSPRKDEVNCLEGAGLTGYRVVRKAGRNNSMRVEPNGSGTSASC
jgi:hypothetical protein